MHWRSAAGPPTPTAPIALAMDLRERRDRIWDMWTTATGLCSWLCVRARVEPEVGGAYELYFNPDATRPLSDSTIGCRVLSIDRPRLLVVSWRASDAVAAVMDRPGAPVTQVEVRLFPTLCGTRLELRHSGWGSGPEWGGARAWFERAWSSALERLRIVLAQR